jgi:HPt (histidine-containing phosphotransfer) domain-containing protein
MKPEFYARFAESCRQRIDSGRRAAASGEGKDLSTLARELHSMAGEAGLLAIPEVMTLARAAEQATHELADLRSDERRRSLEIALDDLDVAIRNAARARCG